MQGLVVAAAAETGNDVRMQPGNDDITGENVQHSTTCNILTDEIVLARVLLLQPPKIASTTNKG